MTREEAISILKQYIDYNNPDTPNFYTMEEAIEVVIKALEQEPCTDAISRQAVLERAINAPIAKVMTEDKVIYRKIVFADEIENIPPVTPAEKVGHWIDHQEDRWIYAKCSECETIHDTRTNYCPNCGSRMMQEVEE